MIVGSDGADRLSFEQDDGSLQELPRLVEDGVGVAQVGGLRSGGVCTTGRSETGGGGEDHAVQPLGAPDRHEPRRRRSLFISSSRRRIVSTTVVAVVIVMAVMMVMVRREQQ